MKKIMISLLVVLAAGILFGCQKGESAKLKVYFVEDEANFYYSYIAKYTAEHSDVEIDMKKYSDIDDMETQLVAAISGGKSPDVVLLDERTSLDAGKMVQDGQFLDLAPYMEEYTEEKYYTDILKAVKTGEHQYILPVGYAVPQLLTSREAGVYQEGMDGWEFMESFRTLMEEQNKSDEEAAIYPMCPAEFSDWINYLGISLTDGRQVVADEEAVRAAAGFYHAFAGNVKNGQAVQQRYASDFVTAADKIDIFMGRGYLPGYARYYESVYTAGLHKEFMLGTVPAYGGGVNAVITHFGMVSQSTRHEEQAVSFLLGLLDANLLDTCGLEVPVSVSREVMADQVDLMEKSKGKKIQIGSGTIQVDYLSGEMGERVLDILDRVTGAALPNAGVDEILDEGMAPYFEGQAELEECMEQVKRRLSVYVSE